MMRHADRMLLRPSNRAIDLWIEGRWILGSEFNRADLAAGEEGYSGADPDDPAWYAIHVPRIRAWPPASFRLHLPLDTLALG
jgi:hypothetical protein